MRTFTRLKAGEKVAIREGAYNACLDAAEAHVNRLGGEGIEGRDEVSRFVVRIKNNTGAQINFGNPVMLAEASSSLRVFTGDHYETTNEPAFSGVFRSATETTMFPQQYAVAMEPIPDGEFGRACVRGVCVANTSGGTSGWLMPVFTSSSSGFAATTKRTNARVLYALAASQYSVIYLDDAPWQTRRSYVGAPTTVTSATRGQTYGGGSNADGFSYTGTGGVIGTSIIKVPCEGMYDFRYNLHAVLTINGGLPPSFGITGAFPFNVRNAQVMAKIVLVDDSTGALLAGINWPTIGSKNAGLIDTPILVEHSGGIGYGYAINAVGSAHLETRFSLFSSPSLSVGLSVEIYTDVPSPPSMTVNCIGTGIVRPAEQEIYVAPPVP